MLKVKLNLKLKFFLLSFLNLTLLIKSKSLSLIFKSNSTNSKVLLSIRKVSEREIVEFLLKRIYFSEFRIYFVILKYFIKLKARKEQVIFLSDENYKFYKFENYIQLFVKVNFEKVECSLIVCKNKVRKYYLILKEK